MAHRTTVLLEDDVHQALRARMAEGASLRQLVNDAIRRGLAPPPESSPEVDLLVFDIGVSIDVSSTGAALEALEGPEHR